MQPCWEIQDLEANVKICSQSSENLFNSSDQALKKEQTTNVLSKSIPVALKS